MQSFQDLERHGTSGELVIVFHGYARAGERMASVREVIAETRPNADIYAPLLPFARALWRLCFEKGEAITAAQMQIIDAIVRDRAAAGDGYGRVTFVGHSFGAVLARKIAVAAFGEQFDREGSRPAPFEPELAPYREKRPWADRIDRLVLLAGMNRGWTVSSAMDWLTSLQWGFAQLIGETLFRGRPTIFAIRRGAPFLVQTRLQWLALMSTDYGPRPDLLAVQLLGSGDDQVSPDDNVDYSVDLVGSPGERSYFYVEVPYSTHSTVIDMGRQGPGKASEREGRRNKFILALTDDRHALSREAITRDQMADTLPPEPDAHVTDVVFVVHGIRDKGFWTQKIARTIKRHAGDHRKIESWTESYGYFAMLPFILRNVRRRKVEWLMDRYTEARARYPNATFHYVGHSNGTFLAAAALQLYPAARFQHIVFAGSVVRRDYDWRALIEPNPAAPRDASRVVKVLNYVATKDRVVAMFPKGLQTLGLFNLGSAGHDGFDQGSSKSFRSNTWSAAIPPATKSRTGTTSPVLSCPARRQRHGFRRSRKIKAKSGTLRVSCLSQSSRSSLPPFWRSQPRSSGGSSAAMRAAARLGWCSDLLSMSGLWFCS